MVEHIPKKQFRLTRIWEWKKKHGTESRLYVVIRSDKVISGYEGFFFRSFFPFNRDFNIHSPSPWKFLYQKHTKIIPHVSGFSNWFMNQNVWIFTTCKRSERWNTFFLFDWMCNTVRMMIHRIIQWMLYICWSNLTCFFIWHKPHEHTHTWHCSIV